jgi:L-threonylcarbamoyladenylate synthase
VNTLRLDDSSGSIDLASAALGRGELVAFPTETVYGLGARADDERAVRDIFAAKGRPEHKPLIVHVRDIAQAKSFTASWPEHADALARAFWPGPVTLIMPKAAHVNDAITRGGDTVAVRAPAHPLAIRLLAALPFALVASSANRSGEPAPTSADEVLASLGGRIPYLLDGGRTHEGIPSTIVDLSHGARAFIVREGAIKREEIARIVICAC